MNFYLVVIVAIIGSSKAAPNGVFNKNKSPDDIAKGISNDCYAPIKAKYGTFAKCVSKVQTTAQADLNAKLAGLKDNIDMNIGKLRSYMISSVCGMAYGLSPCFNQAVKVRITCLAC